MEGEALIGLGGDAAEPLALELLGSSAVVAGPARSGRSTALGTIALSLGRSGGSVIAVAGPRSLLQELRGVAGVIDVLDGRDATGLVSVLEASPEAYVIVDDVERLMDTEAEDVVLQWFKGLPPGSGGLAVGGSASEMAAMFRGLSVVARRSGHGVLLSPTSYADGDLLGVRIGPSDAAGPIPGRGLLVRDGTATPIQVAG